MTKDEALKMALEALEADELDMVDDGSGNMVFRKEQAITAIKKALAQPEQTNTRPYYTIDELNAWADEKEKQAWRNAAIRIGEELSSVGPDGYYDMNAWQWLDWAMENVKKAQPKQEPLAWISTGPASMIHWTADKPAYGDDWVPLYTTPPQRTWVGLTDEEIKAFDTWHDHREEEVGWCNPSEIVAYIEAKLKEKNT